MIHHYALIAEFEYDDENGEYVPPSSRDIEEYLIGNMKRFIEKADLTETHFEVARGTLHEAFSVPEVK